EPFALLIVGVGNVRDLVRPVDVGVVHDDRVALRVAHRGCLAPGRRWVHGTRDVGGWRWRQKPRGRRGRCSEHIGAPWSSARCRRNGKQGKACEFRRYSHRALYPSRSLRTRAGRALAQPEDPSLLFTKPVQVGLLRRLKASRRASSARAPNFALIIFNLTPFCRYLTATSPPVFSTMSARRRPRLGPTRRRRGPETMPPRSIACA